MRAYAIVVAISVVGLVLPATAMAQDERPPQPPATPDPNFAGTFNGAEFDGQPMLKKKCVLDTPDRYEKKFYEVEGWDPASDYERYPGSCVRMRFAYGPIPVKPGQNDVLVGPVTIEKPLQDGYITRFKPNLDAHDGSVPPVHEVHLHHGTWLALTNEYGTARSSPPARRRRSRRSPRATACRSSRPTSGSCSTWSTRPCSSRWRSTSPTRSTSCRPELAGGRRT